MRAIEPEVIAILVYDENLRAQAQSQRPFPFGHDRLARADDAHVGIAVGVKLAVELPPSVATAIGAGAVDARLLLIESLRDARVAGHEVNGDSLAPTFAQLGNELFEQAPGTAFD